MELGAVCASARATTPPGSLTWRSRSVAQLEELRLARSVLDASRTPVLYEAERGFTKSVHVLDPDGNEIELYVDISET